MAVSAEPTSLLSLFCSSAKHSATARCSGECASLIGAAALPPPVPVVWPMRARYAAGCLPMKELKALFDEKPNLRTTASMSASKAGPGSARRRRAQRVACASNVRVCVPVPVGYT